MPKQTHSLPTEQAINIAIQHHQEGRLTEAETMYQQVLRNEPNQPIALHLLGAIAYQAGNNAVAIDLISQALSIKPDYAEAHSNLGLALQALGQTGKATEQYRTAISLKPDLAEAYNNLGVVLRDIGKLEDAVTNFQKSLAINPEYADALDNLGIALRDLGNPQNAVTNHRKALTIKPDNAAAHNNLGLALQDLGETEEAIESYDRALAIKPELVETHYNLGNALRKLGKFDQAQARYLEALRLKPDYTEAHYDLGNLLSDFGKCDEAEKSFQQALRLKPDYAAAHNNLGNVFWALGKAEEAEASFQKATHLEPSFAEAHNNLGALYNTYRQFEKAASSLRKALELSPQYAEAHNNLANVLFDQGRVDEAIKQIDLALSCKPGKDGWRVQKSLILPAIPSSRKDIETRRNTLVKSVEALRKQNLSIADPYIDVGTTSFYLAYHDKNNRNIMEEIAKLYISACPQLAYEAEHCRPTQKCNKDVLRVGFISSYFWDHTIGRLTQGIIQNLRRDRFQVTVFRPPRTQDRISRIIDQHADKIVPLHGSLEQARGLIENEQPDILFYPDIGMSPLTYFLAFSRLAPVQAVTWGHPDTTGIPNIDYFVSSELLETSVAPDHYSEQLISLKTVPTYFFRPDSPKNDFTRSDFGLPENVKLYLCPQALFKFHPEFDDILYDLHSQDPHARIVLIDDTSDGSYKNLLLNRLHGQYADLVGDMIFIPRVPPEKFLGLLTLADVVLDIPSFSGGRSSLEAFAMSVPIVTWPHDFMRGRVTAALYKQMGLKDLIATDAQSYTELALKLAHDTKFKRRMQDDIKANSHKLFERSDTVQEIETFFIDAYENWRKNNHKEPVAWPTS